MAQERVLDDKIAPLTDEGGQSREEDAEEFTHPGRVADRAGRSFALLQRSEHSSFSWLLEPMLERAGFEVKDVSFNDSRVFAAYLSAKR